MIQQPLSCIMNVSDVENEINTKLYKDETGTWVCTDCGYSSKTKSHVYEHIERKHLHHEYQCGICEVMVRTKNDLGRHKKQCHPF